MNWSATAVSTANKLSLCLGYNNRMATLFYCGAPRTLNPSPSYSLQQQQNKLNRLEKRVSSTTAPMDSQAAHLYVMEVLHKTYRLGCVKIFINLRIDTPTRYSVEKRTDKALRQLYLAKLEMLCVASPAVALSTIIYGTGHSTESVQHYFLEWRQNLPPCC